MPATKSTRATPTMTLEAAVLVLGRELAAEQIEVLERRLARESPLRRLERMVDELIEAERRSVDRTGALRRAKVRQEHQALQLRRLQERRAPQRQLRVSNPAANLRQAQHLRVNRPRRSP